MSSPPPVTLAAFVQRHTRPVRPPLCPELLVHVAEEPIDLWMAVERELGLHQAPPPFWAFCWAGGQALARLVLDRPDLVRGQRVLDLGCGGGVVALAAARAGAARVEGNDIDPLALATLAINAETNGLTVTGHAGDLLCSPPADRDVVLVGDLCYEQPLARRLLTWLGEAVEQGADVLVADAGRAYPPRADVRELAAFEVPTSPELEGVEVRRTRVLRLGW
jgi:predicted nicotinamide N-methyase